MANVFDVAMCGARDLQIIFHGNHQLLLELVFVFRYSISSLRSTWEQYGQHAMLWQLIFDCFLYFSPPNKKMIEKKHMKLIEWDTIQLSSLTIPCKLRIEPSSFRLGPALSCPVTLAYRGMVVLSLREWLWIVQSEFNR